MQATRPSYSLHFFFRCGIFFILYYISGKLGLSLASVQANATPVWPPSGIALAGLLLLGLRAWPAVFFGAFLVNATTVQTPLLASLGIAVGNTLEALYGTFLISRFAGGKTVFDRPQTILLFLLLAGALSSAISATVGVVTLLFWNMLGSAPAFSVWLTWWLGDMVSMIIVTPVLLIWSKRGTWRALRDRAGEAIAVAVALYILSQVIFGGWTPASIARYPLEYLVIPLLLLAAFRHGLGGAALSVLVMSTFAIRGTLRNFGPFAFYGPNTSLLLLQAFMGTMAVVTMVVAAVVRNQKRAEQELRESQRVLLDQATQLEQFAFVASHDLREPLRKITTYVQLLGVKLEGKLNPEVSGFISIISDSGMRMHALISDLLSYSRVGKEKSEIKPVSLVETMASVLSDLEPLLKETRAAVHYADLDRVRAHPTEVYQLLQNLITNAIKFRKPGNPPMVNIRSKKMDGIVEVTVEDNGIGIDSQYHDQIFRIFQRLSGRHEYGGGNGIGLAICKKIVEENGGRIWLESEPGKGSFFRFTMPAAA